MAACCNPVRRSTVIMTVGETSIPMNGTQRPSLDGAGRVVVVAGRTGDGIRRLFARHLDQPDAMPIPGTDDATAFALSPDGAWLAFVANKQLRKVAMSGGAPVTLAPMPVEPTRHRTTSLAAGAVPRRGRVGVAALALVAAGAAAHAARLPIVC